ncbi:MAG TPA: HPr-rel-A system PqqD family peptide chaperone [Sphingomonas sp.]|jgi:PqqD family protein of HPr-rel-A system
MRYRGPPAGALLTEPLDAFVAAFHRPSGTTHLLVEPAPQILAALGEEPVELDALMDRLAAEFDVEGEVMLAERLAELVAIGLVEAR